MIQLNGKKNEGRNNSYLPLLLKIVASNLVFLLIILIAVFRIIIPAVDENNTELNKKLSMNLVQIAISELNEWDQRVVRKEITLKDAQRKSLMALRNLKYGEDRKDYYWVMGRDGKLIMHPCQPEAENISPAELKTDIGKDLKLLVEKIDSIYKNNSGGFIRYKWPMNKKGTIIKEKISYVQKFSPWGWTIATGFFVEKTDNEISQIKKKITYAGIFLALITILQSLIISYKLYKTELKKVKISKQLMNSEQKFKTMFETSPYGIALMFLDTLEIIEINPAFTKITGYSIEDVFRKTTVDINLGIGIDDLNRYREILHSKGHLSNSSYHIKRKDGEERSTVSSSVVFSMGEREYVLATMIDVTNNINLSQAKKDLEEMIASRTSSLAKLDSELLQTRKETKEMKRKLVRSTRAFEFTTESFMITDKDANIISVNPAFTRITGYSEIEALGENPRILKSDRHEPEFYINMWDELQQNGFWSGQIWNRRKSGEAYPALLTITAITDDDGKIENYIAISQDQSELHQSIDELEQSRMYDKLTGLPNRSLLIDRLSVACDRADEKHGSLAIIMVGLDRFTNINAALGYLFGDKLLHAAAMRLQTLAGNALTLTRFEGDEFIIIFPFEKNMSKALEFIKTLTGSFKEPFHVDNETIHIDASIGISIFPQDGRTPDELLKHASIALDKAKKSEDRTFRLFTEDLNASVKKTITIENKLRDELTFRELYLNYQPKVKPATGKIVGMEALLRWKNARGENISPAEFIPIAEDIGVISKVGKIALFDACSFNKDLADMSYDQVVAVNISPKQFADRTFTKDVLTTIETSMLDPKMVELEITESAIVSDMVRAKRIVEELNNEGVKFSLDDFGTGYSSPSHLMNLPFSAVKIDKSFIDDITVNPKTIAVLSSLALMARNLGIKFIVEGVETEEQLSLVMDLEQDVIIQGYIYSKPLSASDFIKLIGKPSPFSF